MLFINLGSFIPSSMSVCVVHVFACVWHMCEICTCVLCVCVHGSLELALADMLAGFMSA